jgi:hypothetical protein
MVDRHTGQANPVRQSCSAACFGRTTNMSIDAMASAYGLLILRRSRRELLWLGVTAHPNAEWFARQLTETCGWDEPPRYLIRVRDGAYGAPFIRRIRAMGIRDRPFSARSRWQTARSDGNVLITSWSLASAIFATFSHRTKDTTTSSERTYRCRRTCRFGVMCASQGACVPRRTWARP